MGWRTPVLLLFSWELLTVSRLDKAVLRHVPVRDECLSASPNLCCLASVQTGSELLVNALKLMVPAQRHCLG